ncbi:MAG: glycosyltransferase family 2 protein [Simkaniaceae bacterium]|nr:glycosyltransferase family 2 protein [Simkaniaceae bacterium]
MKTFFSILVVFCVGLTLGLKQSSIKKTFKKKKAKEKPLIATATHPVIEDKPFVVLVMSYNNSAYCEKNLQSVVDQDYKNYRVIYGDDCSSDDTYEKVQSFVTKHHMEKRFTLIRNEKNQGAAANFYSSIHTCKDEEIAVILDGDDWFAHPYVLSKLNAYYASSDVWMTYGKYLMYPTYAPSGTTEMINPKICRERGIRNHEWVTSHLKTFYAGLFKRIHLKDLVYQGKFYPMASDLAFMFPMIEMARLHHQFIPDVLVDYNGENPINDHKGTGKQLQRKFDLIIRARTCYGDIESPF